MTTLHKVIDKIQKLQRLATSSNPHEAARAAAAAAALMARFNLEEAQVLAMGKEEDEPLEVDALVERGPRRGRPNPWRGRIASGLAESLGCQMYWKGSDIVIVGRQQDARAIAYLLGLITHEVDRLAEDAWIDAVGEEENGRRWKASFRLGCAQAIRDRLYQEARERRAKREGNEQALMVLDQRLMRVQAMFNAIPGMRKGRGTRYSHSSAFREGVRAGNNVNLARNGRATAALPAARKEVSNG